MTPPANKQKLHLGDQKMKKTAQSAALEVAKLVEALEELVDLMEDTRQGEYIPDSLTTQPARAALAAYRAREEWERRLKMETKYASLIEQFERVTEAYEATLAAVKTLEAATGKLPDVLGVSGGVTYLGDKFENCRAIHLNSKKFTEAALDCGSGFQCETRNEYTWFECTLFGYRVFALFRDDERGYAELKEKVEADTTHCAIDK